MSKAPKERLSVFLSLVLRHKPEAASISLDSHGWADVHDLIKGVNGTGRFLTSDMLEQIVIEDSKQRYSFNEDHTRIRANQGHSISVDVGLQLSTPPTLLYHGTASRFLNSISVEGITKQSRQYVHLSSDIETARKVGERHGKCVVLTVNAMEMFNAGYQFWPSENGVWLCKVVPVRYINL